MSYLARAIKKLKPTSQFVFNENDYAEAKLIALGLDLDDLRALGL
jgi:hypothetical protein